MTSSITEDTPPPTSSPKFDHSPYPDRILPKAEGCAKELKKRTLTNLYNQRPVWLDHVHQELDAAVAGAYGWPAELADDDILVRLFALNQERAGVAQALPPAERIAASD